MLPTIKVWLVLYVLVAGIVTVFGYMLQGSGVLLVPCVVCDSRCLDETLQDVNLAVEIMQRSLQCCIIFFKTAQFRFTLTLLHFSSFAKPSRRQAILFLFPVLVVEWPTSFSACVRVWTAINHQQLLSMDVSSTRL